MTIKNKLLISFGAILVLMVFMGIIAYTRVDSIERENLEIVRKMELIHHFAERKIDHLTWLNKLSDSIYRGVAFEGQLDHTRCNLGSWYYAYLESEGFSSSSEEVQQYLLALEEPHTLMHQSAAKIVDLLSRGDDFSLQQAQKIYQEETLPNIGTLGELMHVLEELYHEEQFFLLEKVQTFANTVRRGLIATISLSFFIALAISLLLARSIVSPISVMTERAQKIAQGDLTQKIEINKKDEMGILAKAFNIMLEGIYHLLEQINSSAQGVEKLSQNLSETTDALSSSIQEVAGSTNHVAASAQQLSGNSQDMAHESREISEMAIAGEREMGETVEKMQEIQKHIVLLGESIERLDQRSTEINKIINMINGIAEQTNLLALNAAIEAARAGEQGRGFSVVAEEVRKLAEQTTQATAEIGELIKAIQEDTASAVQTMERSAEHVEAGSMVMKSSAQSFRRIVDSAQMLIKRFEETAAAVEELSASSQQVAAATQQQSAATEEIAFSSSELKRSAEILYEQVAQFKL